MRKHFLNRYEIKDFYRIIEAFCFKVKAVGGLSADKGRLASNCEADNYDQLVSLYSCTEGSAYHGFTPETERVEELLKDLDTYGLNQLSGTFNSHFTSVIV